jgi:dipeptidyl-peptidase-4
VDVTDNLTFLNDNSFIWTSEKTGLIISLIRQERKITQSSDQREVTCIMDLTKRQILFYQSTENGSVNRAVYRIALNGKSKLALSKEVGSNDATFSPTSILY